MPAAMKRVTAAAASGELADTAGLAASFGNAAVSAVTACSEEDGWDGQ